MRYTRWMDKNYRLSVSCTLEHTNTESELWISAFSVWKFLVLSFSIHAWASHSQPNNNNNTHGSLRNRLDGNRLHGTYTHAPPDRLDLAPIAIFKYSHFYIRIDGIAVVHFGALVCWWFFFFWSYVRFQFRCLARVHRNSIKLKFGWYFLWFAKVNLVWHWLFDGKTSVIDVWSLKLTDLRMCKKT